MHSKITDRTKDAWKLLKEGKFQDAYDEVSPIVDEYEQEDEKSSEEEEGEENGPLPTGAGGASNGKPVEYWDAMIVKMLSTLGQEEDAETWDAIEKLLPCNNAEVRNLAVGVSRLSEGLLIQRLEEMGSTEDSQKSLDKAAQELEDNVLTFQGNVREDADVKDRFLAAFSRILGKGKWDQLSELIEDLNEQNSLSDEEGEILEVAENISELKRRCTPEKIEEVKDSGMPHYYQIFMELMEWGGSDLEDL